MTLHYYIKTYTTLKSRSARKILFNKAMLNLHENDKKLFYRIASSIDDARVESIYMK